MARKRLFVGLLCWQLCVSRGANAENVERVNRAADQILERFHRGVPAEDGEPALRSSWLVAAALCARGEFGAARYSAHGLEATERARLEAYVAGAERGHSPRVLACWKVMTRANRLRLSNRPSQALDILGALDSIDDPVHRVLYHSEKAQALLDLSADFPMAARDAIAAARWAHSIAWTRKTNHLLRHVVVRGLGEPYTYTSAFLQRCKERVSASEVVLIVGIVADQAIAVLPSLAGTRYVPICSFKELKQGLPNSGWSTAAEGAHKEALQRIRTRIAIPKGIRRILLFAEGEARTLPYALLFPKTEVCQLPAQEVHLLDVKDDTRARGVGTLAVGIDNPERDIAALEERKSVAVSAATADVDTLRRGGERQWHLIHLATPCSSRGRAEIVLGADKLRQRISIADLYGFWWRADVVVFSGKGAAKLVPFNGESRMPEVPTSRDVDGKAWREFRRGLEALDGQLRRSVVGPFCLINRDTPRVIVALWDVDATVRDAFLSKFLESWRDGKDAITAFHMAQVHVRSTSRWRHPRFWAAWQFWGRPH